MKIEIMEKARLDWVMGCELRECAGIKLSLRIRKSALDLKEWSAEMPWRHKSMLFVNLSITRVNLGKILICITVLVCIIDSIGCMKYRLMVH